MVPYLDMVTRGLRAAGCSGPPTAWYEYRNNHRPSARNNHRPSFVYQLTPPPAEQFGVILSTYYLPHAYIYIYYPMRFFDSIDA